MPKQNTPSLVVMKSTLSRLPLYYSLVSRLQTEGVSYVSSALIAQHLNLNSVLVRKDLARVSSVEGKPRTGFEVTQLLKDMINYLGYNKLDEAILVGVGSMGRWKKWKASSRGWGFASASSRFRMTKHKMFVTKW